jgi:ubiquinone/menaquinone biosynthesis C-methylase UbiE
VTQQVKDSLSGSVGDIPERFVPGEMRGKLIEAEHLSRYRWASRFVNGRRVLDAGCGMAYGSAMMAEAGGSVVGVDIAEPVIEAARASLAVDVELVVGDVARLDFGDGEFEAVVCFETIEHVEDPFAVLDELARVLTKDGLLVLSSPNRSAYPPGNPHHLKEFLPDELRKALKERFTDVELVRQHNWLAATILPDAAYAASDGEPLPEAELWKLAAREPGTEMYTLALASNAGLPASPPFVTLADPVEVRRWLEYFDQQQRQLDAQHAKIVEFEAMVEERARLRWALEQAEVRAARMLELEQIAEELQGFRARAERAERVRQDVMSSLSWRITAPLRAVKRLGRPRR